jgi:hypothetical protein
MHYQPRVSPEQHGSLKVKRTINSARRNPRFPGATPCHTAKNKTKPGGAPRENHRLVVSFPSDKFFWPLSLSLFVFVRVCVVLFLRRCFVKESRQVRVQVPLDVHRWLRLRAAELDLSLADAIVVVLREVVKREPK